MKMQIVILLIALPAKLLFNNMSYDTEQVQNLEVKCQIFKYRVHCQPYHYRVHGGRVVTLSPPTSEAGVRSRHGLK